jgi:hypothetical protein
MARTPLAAMTSKTATRPTSQARRPMREPIPRPIDRYLYSHSIIHVNAIRVLRSAVILRVIWA